MNLKKLRDAEISFLERYPGGFAHPDMEAVGKRHNVGKLSQQTAEVLARPVFKNTAEALTNVVKIVSRSSMVSMFEKPKFRDYINGLSREDRARLAEGFRKLLHGNQQKGFNEVLDILVEGKLGKWSLMTICSMYLRPTEDVFVKPTVTKGVIKQFELEGLVYNPRPSWDFYKDYRDAIDEMKSLVDPSLSPNNAAFTGFLMLTTGTLPERRRSSR
ncbi:MAG: hypothetical protein AAF541_03125 [Pseudomonadota bacterium]